MNFPTRSTCLCALTLALLPWRALAEAKPAPVTKADAPIGPQSTFINEPGYGKDPFFPISRRVPQPKTNEIIEILPPLPIVPSGITCKGINILKNRRYAIINNYTVEQGEEFDLKLDGRVHRVVCAEIKEKSIIIKVNGISKELPLRPGL